MSMSRLLFYLVMILFCGSFFFCKGQIVGLTHHAATDEREPLPITWILQKWNGKLVEPPHPSITIFGKTVSAFGGCNGGSGKISLADDKLKISNMMVTEMACMGNGILQKESDYYRSLTQLDSYKWSEDNLTLSGKDIVLEYKKQELEKDFSLTKTKWGLNAYSSMGMVSSLMRDSKIHLTIQENEVTGFAGCSSFKAKILIPAKYKISIQNLDYKESPCPEKAFKLQEDGFFKQFSEIESYALRGRELTLITKEGEKLYFQPE